VSPVRPRWHGAPFEVVIRRIARWEVASDLEGLPAFEVRAEMHVG
jgi:hypothetical protein